ncbi:MAG: hypothetical protein WC488_03035 [Candidatus Micrarchaeia archaeon]
MASNAGFGGCYDHINSEWKKTAKVILGTELGDLADYEKWLLSLKQPMLRKFSSVSGDGVAFASQDYAQVAKVMALGESPEQSKFKPLNLNEIKDIDSLVDACREQIFYSGNIVLGNSAFVEGSSSVSDSFYVYNSARIFSSKNIACSTIIKSAENTFGCNVSSYSNHSIRCHQYGKGVRNFELCLGWLSSDCYYSYNMGSCTNCMFSFNLRSKRNAVGNLALSPEKYASIKQRLLEQIVSELERKKSVPSLFDIINSCGPAEGHAKPLSKFASTEESPSQTPSMEKAFADTSRLVLGKAIRPMAQYGKWLKGRVVDVGEAQSALGSGKTATPGYENFKGLKPGRFVNLQESLILGERLALSKSEAEKLDFSNLGLVLGRIAFLSSGDKGGTISNVTSCPIVIESSNCHSVLGCVFMKNSAYSVWSNGSDHVFGSAFLMNSMFSIKCYSSYGLNSCFEVDTSSDSTRSYFCHNIENVHESMFCFNAKNLNYAVWNQQVGREAYLKLKGMLQSWLLEKLEKEKKIDLDVFSIGSEII